MDCMKVRVESHSEIPIKISEIKCTELWAREKLPLPHANQQPPGVPGAVWDTGQVQNRAWHVSKCPSLQEPVPTASEFLHH